jgi:FixJ family two-component response regulator
VDAGSRRHRAAAPLQDEPERPQVIMISGHGNIETAVQATKLGAFDFIEKPFSIDALLSVVGPRPRAARADRRGSTGRAAARPSANGHASPRVVPERTLGKSVIASGHGLHTG